MKTIFIKLIGAYKLTLSLIIGGQCRFFPSCSEYARQAIEKHGTRTAAALTVKRILRCNPWSPGGADPVP